MCGISTAIATSPTLNDCMVLVMSYYYKAWAACNLSPYLPSNDPTSLSTITNLDGLTHKHKQNINYTHSKWKWSWGFSSTEVSLIQMCLKFSLRMSDRSAGELEWEWRAIVTHSSPSLDWISTVVQLYHQVLWLQEGVDTGHHARQGSTFFAALGASISSSIKAEDWQAELCRAL